MRKPALSTALVLFTTSASAAPLLGTAQSVALGNFCKQYGCSDPVIQTIYERKVYTYTLKNAFKLEVIRQADNTISSAALYGTRASLRGPITTAFTRSFLGLTFEPSNVARCLDRANPVQENTMFHGSISGQLYNVFCEQPSGKLPTVNIGAQFVQP